MKKICIIGSGGFGREVAWLIERINNIIPTWEIVGFIDDTKEPGLIEGDYPILGHCDFLSEIKEKVWVVCAVGSAKNRKSIINKIKNYNNILFATLVDPSVIMSKRVHIGEGSIICAGTIITVDVRIGNHVIINLDSTVGHDVVIDDFVTVYPSVNISGNTRIESTVELGTGHMSAHLQEKSNR